MKKKTLPLLLTFLFAAICLGVLIGGIKTAAAAENERVEAAVAKYYENSN